MATAATLAYMRHQDLYDEELGGLVRSGQLRQDLQSLRVVESVEESRSLNEREEACIIISASGMCDAGRVVHHLRHALWRENAHVILPGYMAPGTLGRALADDMLVELGHDLSRRERVGGTFEVLGQDDRHGGGARRVHNSSIERRSLV